MTTLAFHFPHRRYHATPWGRYVNEGVVELPPAPWRILRALYSAWRQRHPEHDADTVHPILRQLANPPTYLLPPYRLAHTRHYYPDTQHRAGNTSTDEIIDAFAVLGADATVYVTWPQATFTDAQRTVLEHLARAVPYLGRAESVVDASLHKGPLPTDTHTRSSLAVHQDQNTPAEIVQLLAPQLETPLDFTALTLRPADVRAKKLRMPPSTVQLPYTLPPPDTPRPTTRRPSKHRAPATTVRLAITGRPLPPLTEALPLTDAFRAACIKALTKNDQGRLNRPSALAGKDGDQSPMQGHQHTHFLPRSSDGHRIDELILWTPAGLDDDELTAIETATRGRTIGVARDVPGPHDLHLRITALGPAEDLLPENWRTPATRWKTVTPFVPPRHRKKRQDLQTYIKDEVTRELNHRGLPAPADVHAATGADAVRYIRHRHTKHEARTTARTGYTVHITFHHPLSGPLTLGRHSHFGLGHFTPQP